MSDIDEEVEIVSQESYEVHDEDDSIYEDATENSTEEVAGNDLEKVVNEHNDGNDVIDLTGSGEEENLNIIEEPRAVAGNADVFGVLETIGANIIINGRLDPAKPFVAMTNVNFKFPINAIGRRAAGWIPIGTMETRTRDSGLRPIECELDGEYFKILGVRQIHSFDWFPGKTESDKRVRIRAMEVPGFPHTPDFTLERIELGRPFCVNHLVYIDPVNRYVVVRDNEGNDTTLPFQIRYKRRSYLDAERFRNIREEDFL